MEEFLRSKNTHSKNILDLIKAINGSKDDKLMALGVNQDQLIQNTEKITGFEYKKKEKSQQVQNDKKLTKKFALLSGNDA